jgi:S-methylmethionine-dependent homocysteine/selenocysteine methylase
MAELPQLSGEPFITDGGMETTLIFHEGLELPHFAAFHLLASDEGADALRRYYAPYLAFAREAGVGAVLDTPTWRASSDWGARLGYSQEVLADVNRRAVELVRGLGDDVVVSGCVGPRGDGYSGRAHDGRRGAGVPQGADHHVRGRVGRPRLRADDDVRGRGDRHRARGAGGRPARRDLVHGRDRRPPAQRREPR